MRDRDDIDMETWARSAFEEEPAHGGLGDTMRDDLTRAHAGLTRRRRWAAAGTSGIAVAAVAFAVVLAPGAGTTASDAGPASDGSAHENQPDAPNVSAADRQLLLDCEQVASQTGERAIPNKAMRDGEISQREYNAAPPKVSVDLDGWTVVDRVDDAWGTTAIVLNSDATRWAECTLGKQAGFYAQAVRTPQQVPQGFVKQPDGEYAWRGGDDISWAQDCIQVSNPDCGRDLYFMTTRLPAGVASITVETYDGAKSQARVTDGFVLWRTFGPVLNDYDGTLPGESTTPPIILTYKAPGGEVLSSYNANFLPPIPDGECTGSGGC